MASINILGKEFPLEYTVEAMKAVSDKYGGTQEAVETFETASRDDQLEATIFMLSAMMKGAERRERLRCSLWGEEYKGTPALDFETLLQIMNPQDLRNMSEVIFETIRGSSKTTVDVLPDNKKKEDPK